VKTAIEKVIRFHIAPNIDPEKKISTYADMHHFIRLVTENVRNDGKARRLGSELLKYITEQVVISNFSGGKDAAGNDYADAAGLAVEITRKGEAPPGFDDIFETKYSDLAFAKASRWDKFLEWMKSIKAGQL